MTVFAGMCVGGPLAGSMIAKPNPSFRIRSLGTMPVTDQDFIRMRSDIAEMTQEVSYTWVQLAGPGFWLITGMNVTDAIVEMAGAYEREQIAKREGAPARGQAYRESRGHPDPRATHDRN